MPSSCYSHFTGQDYNFLLNLRNDICDPLLFLFNMRNKPRSEERKPQQQNLPKNWNRRKNNSWIAKKEKGKQETRIQRLYSRFSNFACFLVPKSDQFCQILVTAIRDIRKLKFWEVIFTHANFPILTKPSPHSDFYQFRTVFKYSTSLSII